MHKMHTAAKCTTQLGSQINNVGAVNLNMRGV